MSSIMLTSMLLLAGSGFSGTEGHASDFLDDGGGTSRLGCDGCNACWGPPSPWTCNSFLSSTTLFRWNGDAEPEPETGGVRPLEADRPDFTEASTTVGRRVLQIESGYTYLYHSSGGESVRVQSFGEPLLRLGLLAEWLELRFAMFPLEEHLSSHGVGESTALLDSVYVGMKLALTQQAGVLPEMALTPQLTIPTSGNASTTGAAWPGLNWLYSWEVTERLSLAGSTQGNAVADDTGEEHLVMIQSAVLGWAITEPLGTCIEWFGLFPSGAATAKPEHYLDTCLKYLVTDDIQLDIRFGLGLNEAAADYFTGAGVTVRFR